MTTGLSYDAVGHTRVADACWTSAPEGYRRYERSTHLGDGERVWLEASHAVMEWSVKTRSGFTVLPELGKDLRVRQGQERILLASLGPFELREPVTVVAIVEDLDRCGFAYGTREGHPVSGEEAFIVHRTSDGAVWLTLRSLTRPARGTWRLVFPAALVAQRWYRLRYTRSLRYSPSPLRGTVARLLRRTRAFRTP